MKFKFIAPVVALTFTALISMNSAQANTNICDNSIQKICKDTEAQMKERNAYVAKLKQEIAAEASQKAAPRIEEMKKKVKSYRFIKRMIETFKIKNQELMRSAKLRIGDIESVVTDNGNVDKIKGYMYQAIDESNFDQATKSAFKSTVKNIVVGNFGDFIEKTDLENNVIAQLLSNACGSDGLVDNAFATTLNEQKYVLICPGFLITLKQAASDEVRFNTILQAISHEMGHHIDNGKFGNELYADYLNCLATNHSSRFNKTKDDEKFCKKNEKDPSLCQKKVTESHGGELVADQWGILVTALHAKAQRYSFADAEQMLTDSWVKLCGSGDEGIHPSGDFRIGTLMPTNPSINEVLACGQKELTAPACTFAGEAK